MIAITKEFKQMLQEVFESRGVTEVAVKELTNLLDIRFSELKKLLQEEQLRVEYKLVQSKDGSVFVKRVLDDRSDGNLLTKALRIQWDNLGGCPCFTCHELDKCDIGNPISSVDCPIFSKWLFKEPEEKE